MDTLRDLVSPVTMVFAVSSMLFVGLSYTFKDVTQPLRDIKGVILVLVANFLLTPLWAILLTRLFSLAEPYAVGLTIVACAAGAPFLVKLVEFADGDLAFTAAMLILLLPATVIFMPLAVPYIVPEADVSAIAIAAPLVLSMLLPLGIGLLIKSMRDGWASRFRPYLAPISNISLVLLVVLTIVSNWTSVTSVFGERVIIAAILFIAGSFIIGFSLGTADAHKNEIGLATAQRNIAAATVVATTSVDDSDIVVTVIVTSLATMALLFPLSSQLEKHFGTSVQRQKRNAPKSI